MAGANETLSASRRGIEERRPLPISQELLIRLRIQAGQVIFASRLDGVFPDAPRCNFSPKILLTAFDIPAHHWIE